MEHMLSERKKQILKAVIDAHIACGEPVGSKVLAAEGRIAFSPATIRNELAELTEMGYLMQPHTSAGRIPSEQGYRFYVDSLMEKYDRTAGEIRELNDLLTQRTRQLDRIIDDAGRLMSTLTNYPAIAVRSHPRSQTVRKFNLMLLDPYSFLLIMVISESNVVTKTVRSQIPLYEDELKVVETVLNRALVGREPDQLTLPQMMEMEAAMGRLGFLANPIIKCIYEALKGDTRSDLRIEGVDRFLEYPEFSSVDKLRSMLEMLSNKQELLEIVEGAQGDEVNVYIGSENAADQSGDSTLIFKTITVDGKPIGAIGVIGPCRMDYSKVISTVEQLSRGIAGMIRAQRMLPDPDKRDKQ
ncbi:MAG: heat-inducible transcription repressor HrcA [Clostridia bacterium]|nr:heat-inducible transcription repressor HrcA [Clostridia bacterium]